MQDFYEPKVGDLAPDFQLPSSRGKDIRLKDFAGQNVVLYFYPKDDTPGCTKEACGFRDHEGDLSRHDVVVLGVSADALDSHKKFSTKYDLNFPLLSDQTADVAKMYGAWKEKNLYGRRSWGVARMTYLIDRKGRINKIYKKVDTEKHAEDILRDVEAMK